MLPVRIPVLVVLDLPGASADVTESRDRLLDSIRRAARRRQYAIGTELGGLVLAWLGAIAGTPGWLSVIGVVFAAAGGLYALNARSHLVRSDSAIADQFRDYRGRVLDWLSRAFAVGIYADGHAQTTHPIEPSTISADLLRLADAGRRGMVQARRRHDMLSMLHGILFVALIVVAFVSVRFHLGGPELATVASLVTFAGRASGDTVVAAMPDDVTDGIAPDIAAVTGRTGGPDWPTSADLETIASAWVTMQR